MNIHIDKDNIKKYNKIFEGAKSSSIYTSNKFNKKLSLTKMIKVKTLSNSSDTSSLTLLWMGVSKTKLTLLEKDTINLKNLD